MTEWFRRTTWTADDEREFFARLGRSRGAERRAQYLRIQASHLAAAEPPLHEPALRLLERLLADYPDDIMLALAHAQRAASLTALGRADEALSALRAALAAQRARPNVQTSAPVDFAWLVATYDGAGALRDEALSVLAEFGAAAEDTFPAERYRRDGARAMLLEAAGDSTAAAAAARGALAAAGATHSGFRYHPTLGLVESPDAGPHARLVRLASHG